MQKFLLRIFLAIFFALFLFFSYSAYQYYIALHADDPITPYVRVETGAATVVRGDLAIDMQAGDQYDLTEKDSIITKKNTLAIVTWPDRSETRLGENSRMHIDRMQVVQDYSSIEIEFALEEGQAWSTVVRTIYPGSYFRTRMPDRGVIAGVRGTVYDIDLSRGYIRSVDHSVSLTDTANRSASLLPGEIVSVGNIFQKLSQSIIDSTWTQLNTTRDTLFLDTRSQALREQVDKLSGKTGGLWDQCVRWILSFIPSFEDLGTLESLLSGMSGTPLDIPKEKILGIYQKFQDKKFVQERDAIRAYISTQAQAIGFEKDYIQTFTRGAVWDKMSFSGMTLRGAEGMVTNYTKTLDTQIQSVMRLIPVGDLETKARETLRQLVQ